MAQPWFWLSQFVEHARAAGSWTRGVPGRAHVFSCGDQVPTAAHPTQVKRAQECEANTGPAQRPDLSGAAAGGAGGAAAGGPEAAADEDEVDPLDAFMAEIGQMDKAEGNKPKVDRMEAEDTVEAFVQVGCMAWMFLGVPVQAPGPVCCAGGWAGLLGRQCVSVGRFPAIPRPPSALHARSVSSTTRGPASKSSLAVLTCSTPHNFLTWHTLPCTLHRPASAASSTPTLWQRQRQAAGTVATTRGCGAWRQRWMRPLGRRGQATTLTMQVRHVAVRDCHSVLVC